MNSSQLPDGRPVRPHGEQAAPAAHRATLMPEGIGAIRPTAEAAEIARLRHTDGATRSFGAIAAADAVSDPHSPEIDIWRSLGALVRERANRRAMSAGASA